MEYRGNQTLAIIGGGISGLGTALAAIEKGQNPSAIHIYEGSNRLGGKIQSAMMGENVVDAGAEFMDSDSPTIDLARRLGLNPIVAKDQQHVDFQLPDGRLILGKDFFKSYAPISHLIMHDKMELTQDPHGTRAQELSHLTFAQYMEIAAANVPVVPTTSWLQKLYNWFIGNKNRVHPDIVEAAKAAYASEAGQPAEKISALQFVHEASTKVGEFLESDSGYRLEGGMEQLIHAMKARLIELGMTPEQFHMNSTLDTVERSGPKIKLSFVESTAPMQLTDQIVLALPTYSLSKISGLSSLGMSEAALDLLKNMQYANNIKFMVKVKPDVQLPDANFFSNMGYQCWSPKDGIMTFMVNADKLKEYSVSPTGEKPNELVARCLDNYARSHGSRIDDMFDTTAGNILLNAPGKSPCYATPLKEQADQLAILSKELQHLSKGVGVVGTFMPGKSGEIGFMGCALRAAQHTTQALVEDQSLPIWTEQTRGKHVPQTFIDSRANTSAGQPDQAALSGRGIFS